MNENQQQKLLDVLRWIAQHPVATDPPELAAYQMKDRAQDVLSELGLWAPKWWEKQP